MGTYARCMRGLSSTIWIKLVILGVTASIFIQGAACEAEPTESQCRPYIEKALKEQNLEEKLPDVANVELHQKQEGSHTEELGDTTEESAEGENKSEEKEADKSTDDEDTESDNAEKNDTAEVEDEDDKTEEETDDDVIQEETREREDEEEKEPEVGLSKKSNDDDESKEEKHENKSAEGDKEEDETKEKELDFENLEHPIEIEVQEIEMDSAEESNETEKNGKNNVEDESTVTIDEIGETERSVKTENKEKDHTEGENDKANYEDNIKNQINYYKNETIKHEIQDEDAEPDEMEKFEERTDVRVNKSEIQATTDDDSTDKSQEKDEEKLPSEQDDAPDEEELIQEVAIPENLRSRDHIGKILKLDDDFGIENILEKAIDSTLKSLKSLYDNAIKPLEILYKYRDLSNRHFGDPEIFSKPLILFMGPWSGGKSSTINYLLDKEFSHISLRTGAEPSPAYFNILMYGDEEEVLDGTQLAADWTFSGLQKFGQGLLDRLKGIKLSNKLLEKVNIVEIPGILEIRKQVQRLFPFNDACQWFIDRADIIFLVYDPSKLDVGPETEAILDQLKGREYQTRIILNKADQVKPEELMRVQGTLIWNISPLMSSSEPPVMYTTSLWSMPYESGAPTRLLLAQERAFLKDLKEAIDKRIENKISSARRFAVRVRNHAKMVDCYLTTYYNHKSFFGNRKKVSDDIIENPQKYHIYEGLSTLTNISRYDLPDPDIYRDFFKINPLYDFQKLSETCTYFRGCPINKLDVAIAYDLPELVGKYRKAVEAAKEQIQKKNS